MSRVYQRNGRWGIDFIDANGNRIRKLVSPDKRIAREILRAYEGKVARQQHLGILEDSGISFADFAKVWWERISPNLTEATRARWSSVVENHLKPAFAGPLRTLTAAQVQSYVTRRLDAGMDAGTVNVELRILKHILKRATAWEYLGRNPLKNAAGDFVDGLQALKEAPGRVRYVTADELPVLLDAAQREPYLRQFVIVALNSGMRRNEILGLTRDSIDWNSHIATLRQTKNGDAALVPLNPAAMEALRSLPARLDGRLFPLNGPQLTMAFVRTVRRAGIANLRVHDLRHSFASYLAMNGTPARTLQSLLRHKSPAMTARYSHLSDTHLRTAVNTLNIGAKTA